MRNYAKLGNRPGKPAYRTASAFRNRKLSAVASYKASAAKHAPQKTRAGGFPPPESR